MATRSRRRRHFGGIRKLPSGRYQASYWNEGQQHKADQPFAHKADAQAWLSIIEADLVRDQWVDGTVREDTTFGEYAEAWLERRAKLQPTTRSKYRGLLDRHLLPTFGSVPLAQIRAGQVSAWYGTLAVRRASTAAGAYRLLATICNTAVREDVLTKSPCRVEGGATERSAERPTVSRDVVQHAVDAVPEQYRAALLLAAWCQLRRSEVLALQRDDIDLQAGSVRVRRAWVVTQDGTASIERPKSQKGYRVLYMTPDVLESLRTHLDNHVSAAPDAWLFPNRDGSNPVIHRTFARVWARAREASGRPDLRFHDLRHSGLVWFAEAGATIAELMDQAGHASPTAAMRYQHAADERRKMLVARMAVL
jgi:integrase